MTLKPTLALTYRHLMQHSRNSPASQGGKCRLRVLILGAALLASSCSDKAPEVKADCEPLDVTQPAFQRIELDDGLSSDLCPAVDLSAVQDAGAPPCDVQQRQCTMEVECQVDGVLAQGELDISGGQATGFIRIRKPIHCEYWLEVAFP